MTWDRQTRRDLLKITSGSILGAGLLAGSTGAGTSDTVGTLDFGVELQQEATVDQGNNVDISAYVNNNADASVSGVTTELLVDANDDSQFPDDEVVASKSVDLGAGENREVTLTYENVQLSVGDYDYRARVRKDGQTTKSFTDGTLSVIQPGDLPPVVGSNLPKDLDGDGLYEDIDGDDSFDIFDVQAFFSKLNSNPSQEELDALFGAENSVNVDNFDI